MISTPKGLVEEIRERANKATPGPWDARLIGYERGLDASIEVWGGTERRVLVCQTIMREIGPENKLLEQDQTDMDFAAHARADIPYLLEINADLLAALDSVQQLFAPKDSFYIRKFGAPMTNADQSKVDKVFIAVDAAIARAKGQSQ